MIICRLVTIDVLLRMAHSQAQVSGKLGQGRCQAQGQIRGQRWLLLCISVTGVRAQWPPPPATSLSCTPHNRASGQTHRFLHLPGLALLRVQLPAGRAPTPSPLQRSRTFMMVAFHTVQQLHCVRRLVDGSAHASTWFVLGSNTKKQGWKSETVIIFAPRLGQVAMTSAARITMTCRLCDVYEVQTRHVQASTLRVRRPQ